MMLLADWFTGKNFWGYFTPGISIVLPRSALFNIGYSIGNDSFEDGSEDYRNRASYVYYGITFPQGYEQGSPAAVVRKYSRRMFYGGDS